MKSYVMPRDNALIQKAYDDKGYVSVDDFLPEDAAQELVKRWDNTTWEEINQVRPDHYKHVFATQSPFLPRPEEAYMARFDRSKPIEEAADFKAFFQKHFIPMMDKVTGKKMQHFDARCYRLRPGQFYRAHIDDYAGEVGMIYYFNTRWCWDWGGLLMVTLDNDPDFCDVIYPKFNRLVLLNHRTFRFPHFINPVTDYAKTPRYTIVAFCK
ncbi:MAG TPA: 2OG-Fe(II) oxygenase [Verrucomicrobiae bacterium]|jgi:Rps23 Pro-64 3,4-dihydroxylase Tpa1-like proline 4-hydroxylase|nr:2OG-Fe(II) oxygenase [Verrucomicrobiae bacterium]